MSSYSYSSATTGLLHRAREAYHLFRSAQHPQEESANWVVQNFLKTQERIYETTGVLLENMKGLDIGPGQKLGCLRCFSLKNDVIGIDTDVIDAGFKLASYAEMARRNGAMRTLKTFARKALGVDARFCSALAQALGVERLHEPKLARMNATNMLFVDDFFDFVYSHSVFEHIDAPEAALQEITRVLAPSGIAYVSVHLYTSHSGAHDPRILTEGAPRAPLWPHLRPDFKHTVHPNTYLNRVSLAEWKAMFERIMPGVTFVSLRQDKSMDQDLNVLREAGELSQFSDEELLTIDLIAIWRKPPYQLPRLHRYLPDKASDREAPALTP